MKNREKKGKKSFSSTRKEGDRSPVSRPEGDRKKKFFFRRRCEGRGRVFLISVFLSRAPLFFPFPSLSSSVSKRERKNN